MLSNAYFLAKFRFDRAENEPAKNLQKICRKFANFADPNPLSPKRRLRHGGPAVYVRETARAPDAMGRVARAGRRHDGRSAKFRQNVARFRLYRHRFLQENTRFAAFFKVYQIL